MTWFTWALVPSTFSSRGGRPWKRLLFSEQEDDLSFTVSEQKIIDSIKVAKTAMDIDRLLQEAVELPLVSSLPTSSSSSFPSLELEAPEMISLELQSGNREPRIFEHDSSSVSIAVMEKLGFNITASALRRIAHLSMHESKNQTNKTFLREKRKQLLAMLLQNVGEQIAFAHHANETSLSPLRVPALADILEALAVLSQSINGGKIYMQPLARLVVALIVRHEGQEVTWLGPVRLVQCLQSLVALQMDDDNARRLRQIIMQRLLKPDAVSKLGSTSLSYGLESSAAPGIFDDHDMSLRLSIIFMRRMRKKKVGEKATVADICRALVAAKTLVQTRHLREHKYAEEAAVFGFTSIQNIINLLKDTEGLSSAQMADIISSWAVLRIYDPTREDTALDELLQLCARTNALRHCNIWQLEKIVSAVEKLQVFNYPEVLILAGERLLEIVEQKSDLGSLSPSVVNSILRVPILLHRKNKRVLEPYVQTFILLMVDKNFVRRAKVGELANFLWFMSTTRTYHAKSLIALAERILESEVVESCTPKLACRILGAFTSIFSIRTSRDKESDESDLVYVLTGKVFHEYGGYLLSSQLSPAEASSALYAYARASYVRDMGIFDHLVSLISIMADQCTVRQLAQSLWSCGKIFVWEDAFMMEEGDSQNPPYLRNAGHIAHILSTRSSELNPTDVAQCIWALGRLRITNARIVCSFAYKAKSLSSQLNSAEVANIVWGLSKLRFNDQEVLTTLGSRMLANTLKPTPQEVANVLYGLASMEVKDERLFSELSEIIMAQIDQASAQAVANALWAHKVVHISPPQQLLDSWARQRLGLVSIQTNNVPS